MDSSENQLHCYISTPYEDSIYLDDDLNEHSKYETPGLISASLLSNKSQHDIESWIVTANQVLQKVNTMLKAMSDRQSINKCETKSMLMLYRYMSEFLMLTVGNPNQLQEKITSLSLTGSSLGMMHHSIKGSKGADLISTSGTVEDKTSASPTVENQYSTNWVFGQLKASTKQDLLQKLSQKMSAAVVFKSVLKNSTTIMNAYVVPGIFMANYLARKAKIDKGKSNVINLGSLRCKTCHHYHRILYLLAWSKIKFNWCKDLSSMDPDMKTIDALVPTQCEKLTTKQKRFMGIE